MPKLNIENREQLNQHLMEFEDTASLGLLLFDQFDALFSAIEEQSESNSQAAKLAGLGRYLSQDFSNTFDCQKTSIQEAREGLKND